MKVLLYLSLIAALVSCKSSDQDPRDGDEVVRVNTTGIFEPLVVERDSESHIGNFLIGSTPKIVTYTLTNKSKFDLTNIGFFIDDIDTAGMTFVKDQDGANNFPGVGGTCSRTLRPNRSCTIRIIYEPNIPGHFRQKIRIDYTNLVNPESITDSLTALAGNPASVIFVNETTNYNLGIVERTFPEDRYYQELIVENRGGLPAENFNVIIENVPDSGAYRIVENDCPLSLGLMQSCRVLVEFSSMNYGPTAPDGVEDRLSYNTTIRFEYERDPDGTEAVLNGRISILSTSIQAQMERGGIADVSFPERVVGNTFNRQLRFINTGFKEAILHSIDIRAPDNSPLATCVHTNGNDLTCHDPTLPISEASVLSLAQFPFRIHDTNGCMTHVDALDYTWLSDGTLSDGNIRLVSGQDMQGPGETCNFRLTFHPSVSYLSDGNWANIFIDLTYDSTWKDEIVMRSTTENSDFGFRIADAPYRSAGTLTNMRLRLDGDQLSATQTAPRTFHYNLGRITLISDTSFRTNIDFTYRNDGGHEVEVIRIEDGKGRIITEQNQMLDPYYRNANHESCTILSRNGSGTCSVRIQLTPLVSSNPDGIAAAAEENNYMFDELNPNLKRFTIYYNDGAQWEDDLTPREPRRLDVTYTAILARAGFLVYDPQSMPTGNIGTIPNRETTEYSFAIENVGTGPIPFMRFLPSLDLMGTARKTSNMAFPFEFVSKSPAEVFSDGGPAVDIDCYDIFSPSTGPDSTPSPLVGMNAPGILQAGERCSITVLSTLRNTDVILTEEYDEFFTDAGEALFREWDRKINYTEPWTSWDQLSEAFITSVDIVYYDGDGSPDPENDYHPEIEGFGDLKAIGLPSQGPLELSVSTRTPGKLVARNPRPRASAILQRPTFELPFIPIDGWGNPVDSFILPPLREYLGKGENVPNFRAAAASRSQNHINGPALGYLDSAADEVHYNYHAGTFPASESYSLSFDLVNTGQRGATLTALSLEDASPDLDAFALETALGVLPNGNPGEQLPASGELRIDITFSPDVLDLGVHTAYLQAVYRTGVKLEDGSDETDTIRIKVIAEVIDQNFGPPIVTYQDIIVDYDEFSSPQFTETYDPDVILVNTGFNHPPQMGNVSYRAIRGSAVYSLKEFTITNPHDAPITHLSFFIKESPNSFTTRNSTGVDTGYQLLNNTCENINLAPGASCTFEIRFKAALVEPLTREAVGNISYRWSTNNQYVDSYFNIEFVSVDPAILSPVGLNPTTVADSFGNLIPLSYPINLGAISGFSNTSPHLILTSNPTVSQRSPIRILNISEEKASFIAAYRDHVDNPTAQPNPNNDWTVIYEDRRLTLEANHACFYGDDYYDTNIPDDEKGFSSQSSSECFLRPIYTAGTEYLSENIPIPDNVHRIRFYNSQRSSVNFMNFFVTGFIEGNRVSRNGNYLNPYTDETGVFEISWNPMSVNNPAWGAITGYRVYYSDRTVHVDHLYTNNNVQFIDVPGTSATISGLIPMRQYYVRITALRSIDGKTYVSRDRDWGHYAFIVPNDDFFYDFDSHSLITKRLAPEGSTPYYGVRGGALTYCASRSAVVRVNGSNRTLTMSLIGAEQYDAILDNPEYTISDRPLSLLPQWIGGSTVNIIPIFGPESETSMAGNLDLLFYNKPCVTCNNLHYFEGGDPEFHPPGATVFVDGDSFAAFARCYTSRP